MPAEDGRVGQSPYWNSESLAEWYPTVHVRRTRSDKGTTRPRKPNTSKADTSRKSASGSVQAAASTNVDTNRRGFFRRRSN